MARRRPPALRRRDRHGRGVRGPLVWPPVPSMTSRSETFDDLVLDAVERVERRVGQGIGDIEFAVELVPPSDPTPFEPERVPLSRLFAAERGIPARIVLFRRPIETRVEDPRDLAVMINDIVVEQIAGALGVEPTTLDPGYQGDVDP
ncbi:metallopeptidase family protein [Mobilicoccus sp.]|uniref:metallopeptidase family protein n=1 Tax=Mobilicoccus sp. TaxID=2034349 RepID=UPI00289FD644|nr:metallopeptidase family protein [Mobilicoccus sp.]